MSKPGSAPAKPLATAAPAKPQATSAPAKPLATSAAAKPLATSAPAKPAAAASSSTGPRKAGVHVSLSEEGGEQSHSKVKKILTTKYNLDQLKKITEFDSWVDDELEKLSKGLATIVELDFDGVFLLLLRLFVRREDVNLATAQSGTHVRCPSERSSWL